MPRSKGFVATLIALAIVVLVAVAYAVALGLSSTSRYRSDIEWTAEQVESALYDVLFDCVRSIARCVARAIEENLTEGVPIPPSLELAGWAEAWREHLSARGFEVVLELSTISLYETPSGARYDPVLCASLNISPRSPGGAVGFSAELRVRVAYGGVAAFRSFNITCYHPCRAFLLRKVARSLLPNASSKAYEGYSTEDLAVRVARYRSRGALHMLIVVVDLSPRAGLFMKLRPPAYSLEANISPAGWEMVARG